MTHPQAKDYLKLHLIVVILGFTAILGRLTDVSALGVVFYRTFLASLGMFLLARFQKRNILIPLKDSLPLLGVGGIIALHWMCFFGSARASTIAISLVTFSVTSFFTSIMEPLVNKTKISWVEVLLGVLVVMGMYFVFTFEYRHLTGIIIGIIGAFLATVFSVLNAQLTRKYDSQTIIFYEMTGAFVASWVLIPLVMLAVPDTHFQLIPSPTDWIWIAILGLVCTVYPYNEMLKLLKKISAFTLNLSINMEPIYGILLAYIIFGEKERMTTGFYIGGVLILLSVVLHPFLRKKQH
ncbi:DMT family transporter [Emticicia sp. TH156]|uniref:DMT family transporter n=1 Tax=Emticicia sp. TH156 TaxID=2067454 RepID=UPI000C78124A|nr:DMT family transporter [Emticicia sp. TH156]PLK45958.1 EamA family transporter [Emticicia sp. TH156]